MYWSLKIHWFSAVCTSALRTHFITNGEKRDLKFHINEAPYFRDDISS